MHEILDSIITLDVTGGTQGDDSRLLYFQS